MKSWWVGRAFSTFRLVLLGALLTVPTACDGGGGCGKDISPTATNQVYRQTEGNWTVQSPMPEEAYHVQATVVSQRIYVLADEHFFRYDPSADSWEILPPPSLSAFGSDLASVGTDVYRVAWAGGSGTHLHTYDTITDTWVLGPSATRSHYLVVEHGGLLYAMGDPMGDIDVYDPMLGFWQQLGPIPGGEQPRGATSDGVGIYVLTEGLWVYDPVGDTWSLGPDPPRPIFVDDTAVLGNLVVVTGGTSKKRGRIYAYDIGAGEWLLETSMRRSRHDAGIAALNGRLYVVGGNRPAACR